MDAGESVAPAKPSAWIPLAITFLGAMVPVSTAIHGFLAKEKELELAVSKQTHDIRLAYLDRAIDPSKGLAYREQVLRFLAATTLESDPVKGWAKTELGAVAVDLNKVEDLNKQVRELQEKALAQAQELQTLTQRGEKPDPNKVRALTSNLNKARFEIATLQATKNVIDTKAPPPAYPDVFQAAPLAGVAGMAKRRCKPDSVRGSGGGLSADRATQSCADSLIAANPANPLEDAIDPLGLIGRWTVGQGRAAIKCSCDLDPTPAAAAR